MEKENVGYGLNEREMSAAALFRRFSDSTVTCRKVCPESQDSNVSYLFVVCELAGIFSQIILKGPQVFESFYSEVEKILRLSQASIHNAVFETLFEVEKIVKAFKLQTYRPKDIITILDNAGKTSVRISQIAQCPLEADQPVLPSLASIDKQDCCVKDTLEAVAHEIRNPITAVGGFARKLATSLDPESLPGKYAKVILHEALRLEKILSEMPASLHPVSDRAEALGEEHGGKTRSEMIEIPASES